MKQVPLFLIGVFSVTWTLCLVLRPAAAQGQLWALLAWLLPTVWAPTVIALILTLWSRGAAGVRQDMKRLSYRRGARRWLFIAAVFPAVATALAVLSGRAAGDSAPFTPVGAVPIMVAVQLATGAVGEELGWRGFLLPRLGLRFGEMSAAWIMAILWSLWHVSAFFFPSTPHYQLMPPIQTLLFIVLFGVFLAFIFNRTEESILATMLAHLSLNISSGFGGVRLSSSVFWWVLVGIYGAVALIGTVALRFEGRDRNEEN